MLGLISEVYHVQHYQIIREFRFVVGEGRRLRHSVAFHVVANQQPY